MAAIIKTFGSKDPTEVCSRNFLLSKLLAKTGGVYQSATVELNEADSPDDALVVSNVAYSSSLKRVSFRLTGGTLAVTYKLTCTITLVDGRTYVRSAWQPMEGH